MLLFIEKKQLPGELCFEYAMKLKNLGLKALGNSLSDELLLSLFVQGLRQTEVKAHLMIEIMLKKIKTFDEALLFTENIEETCLESEAENLVASPAREIVRTNSTYPKSEVVIKALADNRNIVNSNYGNQKTFYDIVKSYDCTEVDLDKEEESLKQEADRGWEDFQCKLKKSRSRNRRTYSCRNCGRFGHIRRNCPLMDIMCFGCNEMGHYRHSCPKRMRYQDEDE